VASRRLKRVLRNERGFAGVDAAIFIAFLLVIMGLMAYFLPNILQFFASEILGGSEGAYSLLIELPILENYAEPKTAAQWVGKAALQFHTSVTTIALAMFAIVLFIAGICYALESFKIMNEGTAANIVMNSVFTLILIFAVRPIYNTVSSVINVFTGWPAVGGSGLVIGDGNEIQEIIRAVGGSFLLEGFDIAIRFFGSIVIFTFCVSILMVCVSMGAVRLLLLGCLTAILPLLLVLRLIPPIRHIADSLIETIIGLIFASVMSAIILHFGFVLVAQTGLSGLVKMMIALSSLLGCAYMSTFFAGRLGALFTSTSSMASAAAATGTGLFTGAIMMTTGTLTGGATAAAKMRELGAGGIRETLKGFGTGAIATAAQVLPALVTGASAGTILSRGAAAVPEVKKEVEDLMREKAGEVAQAVLLSGAVKGLHPLAGDSARVKEFNDVEYPNLVRSGKLFETYLPPDEYPELHKFADKREVEENLRTLLDSMSPEMRFSTLKWIGESGPEVRKMDEMKKMNFYKAQLDNAPQNQRMLQDLIGGVTKPREIPEGSILWATELFHAGERGKTAMSKLICDLMEDEDSWSGVIDQTTKDRIRDLTAMARDPSNYVHLGELVGNYTDVKLTPTDAEEVGFNTARMILRAEKTNPDFLAYTASKLMSNPNMARMNDEAFIRRALENSSPNKYASQTWIAKKLHLGELPTPPTEAPPTPPPAAPPTPPPATPPSTPPPAAPSTPPPAAPPAEAPQVIKIAVPPPSQEPSIQKPPAEQPQQPKGASGDAGARSDRRKRGKRYNLLELQRMMYTEENWTAPWQNVGKNFDNAAEKMEEKG